MNAKQEFLGMVKDCKVICAMLYEANYYYLHGDGTPYIPWQHSLKKGYSEEDYQAFLKSIDFDYYNGYGGQNVDGTIWCEDGIWFDRGEYDGSEWWQGHQYPDIPEALL